MRDDSQPPPQFRQRDDALSCRQFMSAAPRQREACFARHARCRSRRRRRAMPQHDADDACAMRSRCAPPLRRRKMSVLPPLFDAVPQFYAFAMRRDEAFAAMFSMMMPPMRRAAAAEAPRAEFRRCAARGRGVMPRGAKIAMPSDAP